LVDLNKYIKQATVRFDVMVQLVALHKAAGKPDYQHVNMKRVEERARQLNPSNEAAVPLGLDDVLDTSDDERLEAATDKAATPAERISNDAQLEAEMSRARPLVIVAQRDSDAQKYVQASRSNAPSTVSEVSFNTGSSLLDQFNTAYIPRVFNLTLPRHVGGPDFPRQKPWRRVFDDSPRLELSSYVAMMGLRAEAQIRWDWDLNPGLWSLHFASQVNLSQGIAFRRVIHKLEDGHKNPEDNVDVNLPEGLLEVLDILKNPIRRMTGCTFE